MHASCSENNSNFSQTFQFRKYTSLFRPVSVQRLLRNESDCRTKTALRRAKPLIQLLGLITIFENRLDRPPIGSRWLDTFSSLNIFCEMQLAIKIPTISMVVANDELVPII